MTERVNGQELVFDFELEAPPEKVWRALTVPALRDHWLEPLRGSEPAAAPDRQARSIETEVIEADAPRRLSWHWREAGEPDGVVSFTLMPSGAGGTLLRLVHVRQRRTALPPAANRNFGPLALAA